MRILDKVLINTNLKQAVLYFSEGHNVVLTTDKDIVDFYFWFMFNCTLEQYLISLEDTQVIELNELSEKYEEAA